MKKRYVHKYRELTSSLCPRHDVKDNNLIGIHYLNKEQIRDHLMTHTHSHTYTHTHIHSHTHTLMLTHTHTHTLTHTHTHTLPGGQAY